MNYVVMNAIIQGYISKESLNSALNSLSIKHLFLKARIEIDKNGSAWFVNQDERLNNSEYNSLNFEIRVFNDLSKTEIEKVMEKEHTRFFDVLNGPLIRFSLVHNRIKTIIHTFLIICSHHSICDGISLTYLIRDILSILGKENYEENPQPPPPVIDERYISKTRIPFATRFLLKIINKIWKKYKIQFNSQDFRELHDKFWTTYDDPYVITDNLSKENTLDLIEKCRNHQVTVHSALMTAFIMAQTHFQGNNELYLRDFHMPIDIRNRLHIPTGDRLGFYAVSMILKHNIDMDKSFWDNSKIIHSQIQKWLASCAIYRLYTITFFDPFLLDSLYFEKLGLISNKISRLILKKMGIENKIAGVAVTNLGNLKIPTSYGRLEIKGIFGPSVYTEILEKVVGAATINDQLCLTLTSGKDIINRKLLEDELAYVKNLLITSLK